MEIYSPGYGITADQSGKVTDVTDNSVEIEGYKIDYIKKDVASYHENNNLLVWPKIEAWQEPVVSVGDEIKRKELVARGVTRIFFQANVWMEARCW